MTLPDSSDSTSEVRVDSPVAGPPNVQSPTPPPEDANTDGQVEQKPPTDSDSSSNSRLSIPRIATSDDLKASAGIEKPPGSIPNIPNANHIVKLLAETPPKFLRIGTPPNEDFNGSALSSPGGPRTADVYTNIANPLSTPFEYQEVQRGRPTTTRKASGSSKAKPGTIRTLSSPPTIKRTRSTPRSIPIPQQPFAQLPSINQGEVLDRRPPFNRSRSPRKHSPTCETKTPNLLALQDKELKTSDAPLSSRDHPGRGHERHPSFPALPLNTYLSLALSSPTPNTPAVSAHSDVPQKFAYPSTDPADIVLERLTNFINLPAYLEGCMLFACLACLDNWLWCFTILPLRFLRALGILADYWWSSITGTFHGGKRLAKKQTGQEEEAVPLSAKGEDPPSLRRRASKRPGGLGIRISDGGERGKRVVSKLQPVHKAEILRGLVVLCSCWILMRMDASKLYHTIRGQAAIKLYVIYNVLEMADRLLAALGQDILECLFCRETLERKENGRSKILRPFLCFLLALAYNVAHTGILFYQVVTLNVAVNSYSNALLTLLMSTQFVEIKASVFKKFEKESLFQLTCSDVVERFQLWLMLMIILMRNLVELGVRSASDQLGGLGSPSGSPSSFAGTVWPKSFMFLGGEAGKIFGPFVMVIGSEMVVDWIKHAFITKFNVIRPQTYSKFLDVLCKDYYSNVSSHSYASKTPLTYITGIWRPESTQTTWSSSYTPLMRVYPGLFPNLPDLIPEYPNAYTRTTTF